MSAISRAALLGALAAALLSSNLHATVARAVPFDEKVAGAQQIILGKCVRTESRWDPSRRFILTYSTFAVEKALKGSPVNSEFTVVTPGGSVDGIYQDAIGIPEFEAGDENVVFVKQGQIGPTVLFYDQGAYEVVGEGNQRIVRPVPSSAVFMDTQRGVAVAPEQARPLPEFESEIRASVRRNLNHRMQILEQQKKRQASLWPYVNDNRGLILLALVGAALAWWQFARKS